MFGKYTESGPCSGSDASPCWAVNNQKPERDNMSESQTLGEKLPKECARVRGLIGIYKETAALCPQAMCGLAIAMMEAALKEADQAMITGDLLGMIAAYKTLQEFTD